MRLQQDDWEICRVGPPLPQNDCRGGGRSVSTSNDVETPEFAFEVADCMNSLDDKKKHARKIVRTLARTYPDVNARNRS